MALGEEESGFLKGMAPGKSIRPVDGPTPMIMWTTQIGLGGLLKCGGGGGSHEGVENWG